SFKDGDFVTYHSPPPVATFSSKLVDVNGSTSGGKVTSTTYQDVPGNDNIFIAKDADGNGNLDDSGLQSGDPVTYLASDATKAIGGLTSGSTYFAIRITAQTVQLAQTYCDARGISKGANGVCDSSPSVPHGGDDGLPGSAP